MSDFERMSSDEKVACLLPVVELVIDLARWYRGWSRDELTTEFVELVPCSREQARMWIDWVLDVVLKGRDVNAGL